MITYNVLLFGYFGKTVECVASFLFRDKDSTDGLVLSYCENCEIFFLYIKEYCVETKEYCNRVETLTMLMYLLSNV